MVATKTWQVMVLSLLALAVTADIADARRRMRLPMIIPIPGMSSSSTIVKVLDLPDTPLLKRSDGRYLDLGYRFTGSESGEWIGYVGSSSEYLKLSPEGLSGMMLVAGLKDLPPVPKRPSALPSGSSSSGFMMFLAIAAFFGLRLMKGFAFGAVRVAGRAAVGSAAVSQAQTEDWVAKAEQHMDTASRSSPAPAAAPMRRPISRPSTMQPSVSAAGNRAAFGRRA